MVPFAKRILMINPSFSVATLWSRAARCRDGWGTRQIRVICQPDRRMPITGLLVHVSVPFQCESPPLPSSIA
jgi:hypothetical protein